MRDAARAVNRGLEGDRHSFFKQNVPRRHDTSTSIPRVGTYTVPKADTDHVGSQIKELEFIEELAGESGKHTCTPANLKPSRSLGCWQMPQAVTVRFHCNNAHKLHHYNIFRGT